MPNTHATRESFMLGIASIFLSFLLWFQVTTQRQVSKEKEFTVSVEYRDLPKGLVVLQGTDYVEAMITGPASEVDRINPDTIRPWVDLTGLKPGDHNETIRVPIAGPDVRIKLSRPKATFKLESVKQETRTIEVEVRGQIATDLRYDGATCQPKTVVLTGPESEIDKVQKVRVMLDLAAVRPGIAVQVPIEVLGKSNTPLPYVTSDPGRVDVFPAVAAAATTTTVPVNPIWDGVPAFGFEVSRIELTPSTIRLTGDSEALAKVQILETEVIPLKNARGDVRGTVKVKVPAGLRAEPSDQVQYYVRILPAPVKRTP